MSDPILPACPREVYDIPMGDPQSTFSPRKHSSNKFRLGGSAPRDSLSYIPATASPGKFYQPISASPKKRPLNRGMGTSPRFEPVKSHSPAKYYSPSTVNSPRRKQRGGLGYSPRFMEPKVAGPGVGQYDTAKTPKSGSRRSPKAKPLGLGGSAERFFSSYPRVRSSGSVSPVGVSPKSSPRSNKSRPHTPRSTTPKAASKNKVEEAPLESPIDN
ncbi:hypothetical protein P9112_000249 [Eukaryota sp. TZLM1-RC]